MLGGEALIDEDEKDDESEDELRIVHTDSLLLSAVTDEDEQVHAGGCQEIEAERGREREREREIGRESTVCVLTVFFSRPFMCMCWRILTVPRSQISTGALSLSLSLSSFLFHILSLSFSHPLSLSVWTGATSTCITMSSCPHSLCVWNI